MLKSRSKDNSFPFMPLVVVYCGFNTVFMRINTPIVGFIIGLILPILGFFVVYFLMFRSNSTLSGLWYSMAHSHKSAAKVVTLSLLINYAPFLYFNTKRLDYALRGVVTATMIYAALVVMLMFVW
jgi:hypothetical protein